MNEFGPNIGPTSIPMEPLSFMFPRFSIQNIRLQLDLPLWIAVYLIK